MKKIIKIVLSISLIILIAFAFSGCADDLLTIEGIADRYSLEGVASYYESDEIGAFIEKHLWDYYDIYYFYDYDEAVLFDYIENNNVLQDYVYDRERWNRDAAELIEDQLPAYIIDDLVIDAFQKNLIDDYENVISSIEDIIFELYAESDYYELSDVLEYYDEEEIAAFVAEYNANHR